MDIGGLASSDGVSLIGSQYDYDGDYDSGNRQAGWSVGWAGDLNDDGIDDVAIGDPGFFQFAYQAEGATLVVFGGDLPNEIDLYDIFSNPGNQGIAIHSSSDGDYERSGRDLAGVGDISGDGIDDLLIGAPGYYSGNYRGTGIVIRGRNSFATNRDLSTLSAGNGFVIGPFGEGGPYGYQTGESVALAGDTNGDGRPDMLIGAPQFPFDEGAYGAVHVIFGFQSSDASTYYSDYNGFRIDGADNVGVGLHTAGAGDLNGDGDDDIFVGAPYGNTGSGGGFVIFGGRTDGQNVDLGSFAASDGFTITGASGTGYAGLSGSGVGDINGDGIDDLLVGAPRVNQDDGAVYLIFGKSGSSGPGDIDLNNLTAAKGVAFPGVESGGNLGRAIDASGDVNGDGINDILISAPGDENDPGRVYVIFGGDLSHFEDLLGN